MHTSSSDSRNLDPAQRQEMGRRQQQQEPLNGSYHDACGAIMMPVGLFNGKLTCRHWAAAGPGEEDWGPSVILTFCKLLKLGAG
jgi:hypothetical protein